MIFYRSPQRRYCIHNNTNVCGDARWRLSLASQPRLVGRRAIFLNPHRTYLELRYFGYWIESRVGQLVGGAFRKVESHKDYPDW